jgi:hypothetical protein
MEIIHARQSERRAEPPCVMFFLACRAGWAVVERVLACQQRIDALEREVRALRESLKPKPPSQVRRVDPATRATRDAITPTILLATSAGAFQPLPAPDQVPAAARLRQLTERDKRRVIDLYQRGWTLASLSADTGYCTKTLGRWTRGIERLPPSERWDAPPNLRAALATLRREANGG